MSSLRPAALAALAPDSPPFRWWAVAVVAAVLAVFLAARTVLGRVWGRTPLQRRLDLLKQFAVDRRPAHRRALDTIRSSFQVVAARVTGLGRARRTGDLLARAALAVSPADWLLIRLGAGVASALLLLLVLPWWLGLPVGAAAGWAGAGALLRVRIVRRSRMFDDELPGTLQLVVSSLRAGFTLQHALEAAARDGDGPVEVELRRALSEIRIDGELEDALGRLGERMGSADVRWLVMAIRLQREVGGNLAEVLQTTADTMRERAYLRRHVRGLSAEGRLSARILIALPIAMAALMGLTRPDYIRPLVTEPAGIAMLAVAVILLLAGTMWLRVAVRVEV